VPLAAGDALLFAGITHFAQSALNVIGAPALWDALTALGFAIEQLTVAIGVGFAAAAILAEAQGVAELTARTRRIGAAVAGGTFAAKGALGRTTVLVFSAAVVANFFAPTTGQ
jgi:hypothetical protein